jgi:hypothetical protein
MNNPKDSWLASPQSQPNQKIQPKNHIKPSLDSASDLYLMGDGYSCAFSLKNGAMNTTWQPRIPNARKLRRIINSAKYYLARYEFLAVLAGRIGGPIFVVGSKA